MNGRNKSPVPISTLSRRLKLVFESLGVASRSNLSSDQLAEITEDYLLPYAQPKPSGGQQYFTKSLEFGIATLLHGLSAQGKSVNLKLRGKLSVTMLWLRMFRSTRRR